MFSILYEGEKEELREDTETVLRDLNIDRIIEEITQDWGEETKAFFSLIPSKEETQKYRRGFFTEMKVGLQPAFYEFWNKLRQRNLAVENRGKVEEPLQQQVWFLRETARYAEAVDCLTKALAGDVQSQGMGRLKAFLEEYANSEAYLTFRDTVAKLDEEFRNMRLLLTYEDGRFSIAEGTREADYEKMLNKYFPGNREILKSPFTTSPEFYSLEREALVIFQRQHKDIFGKLAEFCKKYTAYADAKILSLQSEVGYYLAYFSFMERMKEIGYVFCEPGESDGSLSFSGLYDLALACVSEQSTSVVPNDMDLWPEEKFYVLTGPNQGGKTTFARSLGQLIYFTKMGLDVPALQATVPYFERIMTHFSVEESADTGRGKLMDELERLKPMMKDNAGGAFVIINELFTTAANYDACIMGKKVLDFFTGHNCKGIYVTHLSELSRSNDAVVSLRAMLDENRKQTFKIERSDRDETAGANIQVQKYGLTYEQLKERFS